MCGIAGVVSFSANELLPQDRWFQFTDPLKYRGPDDRGHLRHTSDQACISFFHTRLSIIDLSETGRQPMSTDDESIVIVFNGEIYNYQILKKELQQRGAVFRSTSDTEVLLQGYRCWGLRELLNKVDGMFAFALFDKKKNTLFLARDRFGKKPLYYYTDGHQIVFSSDIRSFKALPSITLNIDLYALGYFFSESATPLEHTIWSEIKKVKPAAYIEFNSSGSHHHAYWHLTYTENCDLGMGDIVERAEHLITNAVKKRLVADVNVSALLSGGIDSSLVVAKMAELSPRTVNTYSVGFREEEFNELGYARQVASRFNTNHTELIVDPGSFDGVNDLIREYGEPFADSSMIPTYLVSREVARHEKVVMGGDGGDEIFGGYDSYYFALKYDSVKSFRILHPVIDLISRAFQTYRTQFLSRLLGQAHHPSHTLLDRKFAFQKKDLRKLLNSETFATAVDKEHQSVWNRYSPHSRNDVINVLSASLRTRLLNDYLVKVDRASMYASLEMRSPFLDRDLAEFTATLKPGQIFHNAEPKYILKKIGEKYFGRGFLYRRKMGFGIPIGRWFRSELAQKLKEVIFSKQQMINLDYRYIEQLADAHQKGLADHTERLWALYVFHIWANDQ